MSEHTRWIHLCPFHESLLSYLSPLHQLRSKIPLIGMTVMPIQLSIGARIGFGVGPLKDGLIVGRRAALSDEAQSDDHGTIGDLGIRSSVAAAAQSAEGVYSIDGIQIAPRHDGVFGGGVNRRALGAGGGGVIYVIIVPHYLAH